MPRWRPFATPELTPPTLSFLFGTCITCLKRLHVSIIPNPRMTECLLTASRTCMWLTTLLLLLEVRSNMEPGHCCCLTTGLQKKYMIWCTELDSLMLYSLHVGFIAARWSCKRRYLGVLGTAVMCGLGFEDVDCQLQ